MTPDTPENLQTQLDRIEVLSQWERSELGRALRRAGWTYTEIARVLPAAKSTIAGWCRGIALDDDQIRAIKERTGSVRGVPRDTQRRRREERAAIASAAYEEASTRFKDEHWTAGLMLYWGEGFKTENSLGLANSDEDLIRLFMAWSRRYHDPLIQFRAKLNLHAANDEQTALEHWSVSLALPLSHFNKSFIKPEGTGHRRNHLQHGVIQVRARRSTDHFVRTMGWIEGLRDVWKSIPSLD